MFLQMAHYTSPNKIPKLGFWSRAKLLGLTNLFFDATTLQVQSGDGAVLAQDRRQGLAKFEDSSAGCQSSKRTFGRYVFFLTPKVPNQLPSDDKLKLHELTASEISPELSNETKQSPTNKQAIN